MPKQNGIFQLEGTLLGVSFYKTKDGYMARMKGGVTAGRIKKHPAYKRTRENQKEFGTINTAGKLLRESLKPFTSHSSDNRVVNRITQLMAGLKNLDQTNVRGKRNVQGGLNEPGSENLLKGFNFNREAGLSTVLTRPIEVDAATGVITIAGLKPEEHMTCPYEATHARITGIQVRIDFATGVFETIETNSAEVDVEDLVPSTVVLTPVSVPSGPGIDLFLVNVHFLQEIASVRYALKSQGNALAIVAVG